MFKEFLNQPGLDLNGFPKYFWMDRDQSWGFFGNFSGFYNIGMMIYHLASFKLLKNFKKSFYTLYFLYVFAN